MTKTNRNHRRIITVIAAGSVALGSAMFGFTTSPGRTGGDGISTSPGRNAATPNQVKTDKEIKQGTIRNVQALMNGRKAGSGQQDYL